MKTGLSLAGIAGLIIGPMVFWPVATRATATRTLTCESVNNRYTTCVTDTRGGVTLQRQLSNAPCIEHRTWGVTEQGIWVDKGCRGVFRVAVGPTTLTCRSLNYKYQLCQVDTRGGVRLARQLSNTRCIEHRTWGVQEQGIWVDKGCAGEFLVGVGAAPPTEQVIRCASVHNRRADCPVPTRAATVTLQRQLSTAACIPNRTWGYDERGIWVSNGCRGEFLVSPTTVPDRPAQEALVVCRSSDGTYVRCPADTRRGVLLQRQLSQRPCRAHQTWGFDTQGIWVTQGCEAEFLVRP
ncbi:DUF3011 domain-containing protein [Gloeomargarita sp.]